MADVIRFADKTEIKFDPSERAKMVRQMIDEVIKDNDAELICSAVIMTVDYEGGIYFNAVRSYDDDVVFLGQLEVIKSDIIHRIRERREVTHEEEV